MRKYKYQEPQQDPLSETSSVNYYHHLGFKHKERMECSSPDMPSMSTDIPVMPARPKRKTRYDKKSLAVMIFAVVSVIILLAGIITFAVRRSKTVDTLSTNSTSDPTPTKLDNDENIEVIEEEVEDVPPPNTNTLKPKQRV